MIGFLSKGGDPIQNYLDLENVGSQYSAGFGAYMKKAPAIKPIHGTSLFSGANELTDISKIDFSECIDANDMFKDASGLENVPVINAPLLVNADGMFIGCSNLTAESVNNILGMCANSNIENKRLSNILDSSLFPLISSEMSNYQDFIDEGWELYAQLVDDENTFATDTAQSWDGTVAISNLSFTDNRLVDGTIEVTVDIENTTQEDRYLTAMQPEIVTGNYEYPYIYLEEPEGILLPAGTTVTHTFTGISIQASNLKTLQSSLSVSGGIDKHDADTSALEQPEAKTFFSVGGITKTTSNGETRLEFDVECLQTTDDSTYLNFVFSAANDDGDSQVNIRLLVPALNVGDIRHFGFDVTELYYNPIVGYYFDETRHAGYSIIDANNVLSVPKTIDGVTYELDYYVDDEDANREPSIGAEITITNNSGETLKLGQNGLILFTNSFNDGVTTPMDFAADFETELADGDSITYNSKGSMSVFSNGILDYTINNPFFYDDSAMSEPHVFEDFTFSNAQYVQTFPDEENPNIVDVDFSVDVTYDSELLSDMQIDIIVMTSAGWGQTFGFTLLAGPAGTETTLTGQMYSIGNAPATDYEIMEK